MHQIPSKSVNKLGESHEAQVQQTQQKQKDNKEIKFHEETVTNSSYNIFPFDQAEKFQLDIRMSKAKNISTFKLKKEYIIGGLSILILILTLIYLNIYFKNYGELSIKNKLEEEAKKELYEKLVNKKDITILLIGDSIIDFQQRNIRELAKEMKINLIISAKSGCATNPQQRSYYNYCYYTESDRTKILATKQQYDFVLSYNRVDMMHYKTNLAESFTEFGWQERKNYFLQEVKKLSQDYSIPFIHVVPERPAKQLLQLVQQEDYFYEQNYPKTGNPPHYIFIKDWDKVQIWNSFLQGIKQKNFFTISVDDLVCSSKSSPCQDVQISGQNIRYDGVHYTNPAVSYVFPNLFDRAIEVLVNYLKQ